MNSSIVRRIAAVFVSVVVLIASTASAQSDTAKHYIKLGDAWHAAKNYDRAIADYTEAIRIDPTFASAYTSRGLAWRIKGNFHKAISDYSQAIRLDPKDPNPHWGLALLRTSCPNAKYRDAKKAVQHATKSCELTEWKDARKIAFLAAAYDSAGESEKAEKLRNVVREMMYHELRHEN